MLNQAGDSGLSLSDLMLPPPMDIWSNLTDLTLDLLKSLEEEGRMTGARHWTAFSLRSHTLVGYLDPFEGFCQASKMLRELGTITHDIVNFFLKSDEVIDKPLINLYFKLTLTQHNKQQVATVFTR